VLGAMAYLAAILSQAPRKTKFTLFVFGFILEILLLSWVMIF
jgi:apolipoprotein N-acyltransferase